MADPESFEEDLFADLYDDNDAAAAQSEAKPAMPVAAPSASLAAQPQPVAEEAQAANDQNGTYGEEYQDEAYDDDDDVDFNLGNNDGTNSVNAAAAPPQPEVSAPSYHQAKSHSAKEDGKMFIGGLNWETTDQSLRDYFSNFGEVTECTVMRDGATGRSRGFGFLTFKDPKTVNIVMVKEHFLDGKIIDPKRAIPRDEQEKTSKIFVGGVSQDTTEAEFRDYFAQFGRVVDATLMMDKDTGRPRGFGFVTFESEAGVDACLSIPLEIHGKPIEVKKAQPRGNMREEEEQSRHGRNKFRKGGGDDQMDSQNQMANQMGGQGGMTPQVMAQYMQRMQQYMTMMSQQMAMNRNMGMGMNPGMMNPAMMQQMMQMQMAQQMAQQQGGGGQNGGQQNNAMGGMNPAMMQQMQQQMQQQMAQGGAQGQGGDQGAYNQQQQQFGAGRGGRRGGRGGYGQGGGYGMGGGNGAVPEGGNGDPTSWEGMYDDVPQPNFNNQQQGGRGGFNNKNRGQQSPAPTGDAPPPNAPTGPKNAGRPGANYRGGGRGANRGFHPYSRG